MPAIGKNNIIQQFSLLGDAIAGRFVANRIRIIMPNKGYTTIALFIAGFLISPT
jgi:hypothetical protein